MRNCKPSPCGMELFLTLLLLLLLLLLLSPATIRLNRPSNRELFIFFCGKMTHVIYRFVIPGLFVPWQRLVNRMERGGGRGFEWFSVHPQLLFNLIGEIVGSYWLALIFQTSHVISEVSSCALPPPPEEGWGVGALVTSCPPLPGGGSWVWRGVS